MKTAWIIVAGTLAMAAAGPAWAAQEAAACTAPGTLPPDLSAWSMLAYHDAAGSPAGLAAARLTLGETARVALMPTPAVKYPRNPDKPGAADSFGGLLQLVVPAHAMFRVVLGSRAWIDLVAPDGTAVASAAHSMGPACTGIRKMVDFELTPGTYTMQLSGNPEPATSVLVIRFP